MLQQWAAQMLEYGWADETNRSELTFHAIFSAAGVAVLNTGSLAFRLAGRGTEQAGDSHTERCEHQALHLELLGAVLEAVDAVGQHSEFSELRATLFSPETILKCLRRVLLREQSGE